MKKFNPNVVTSDTDIFDEMESETVINLEKTFEELRIDFAQETIYGYYWEICKQPKILGWNPMKT